MYKMDTKVCLGERIQHCRCCAKIIPHDELINYHSNVEIINIIVKFADNIKKDFNLFFESNFPKTVCKNCFNNIIDVNNFLWNIEEAQIQLRNIYNEIYKIENIKIEFDSQSNVENDIDIHLNAYDSIDPENTNETEEMFGKKSSKIIKNILRCDKVKNHEIHDDDDLFENVSTTNSWSNYDWKCVYCKEKLTNLKEVRSHLKKVHKKCHGYSCADCKERIPIFETFVNHAREHRPSLSYYCQYCDEKFNTPSLCKEHSLTHKQNISCELCGEPMQDMTALKQHKKLYKKMLFNRRRAKRVIYDDILVLENGIEASWADYQWACRLCDEQLPDYDELRLHFQNIHNKCFAIKCMDCSMAIKSLSLFISHVWVHRPYLKRFCQYCNKNVKDKSLYHHVKIHDNDPKKVCPGCEQIFENEVLLHEHMKKFNSPRSSKSVTEDDLTCDVCDKIFTTLVSFRAHKRIHDPNRQHNYTCDVCGKAFLFIGALNSHYVIHGEKSYFCKVCNKAFRTKRNLKEHVGSHLEEKPYQCNDCGKCFCTKMSLKDHMKIHIDSKSYLCKVCDKSFRYKNSLNVHSRQHTGLKPYTCDTCKRDFTNWGNLNKHMIAKHGFSISKRSKPSKIAVDSETKEWIQTLIPRKEIAEVIV